MSQNEKDLKREAYDKNQLKIKTEIMYLQLQNSNKLEKYLEECYQGGILSDTFVDLVYQYRDKHLVSFYEALLHYLTDKEEEISTGRDEIIVNGLRVVLEEVLKVGFVKIANVTFENYEEVLESLKKNKEIIDKHFS